MGENDGFPENAQTTRRVGIGDRSEVEVCAAQKLITIRERD